MGLAEDGRTFLSKLESAGGRMSNPALRDTLGWSDTKYWRVHQAQFEQGFIEKGRGYGGSVILSNDGKTYLHPPKLPQYPVADAVAVAEFDKSSKELDLYEPALKVLQKNWATRRQLDQCHCEITGLQGRRDTGGNWSRPDLAVVGFKKYEYLPDRLLEVFTFEFKPAYEVSVKGVLEALSHREAATRSYVVYYTAGKELESFPEAVRIEELAVRHGVGVMAAKT